MEGTNQEVSAGASMSQGFEQLTPNLTSGVLGLPLQWVTLEELGFPESPYALARGKLETGLGQARIPEQGILKFPMHPTHARNWRFPFCRSGVGAKIWPQGDVGVAGPPTTL